MKIVRLVRKYFAIIPLFLSILSFAGCAFGAFGTNANRVYKDPDGYFFGGYPYQAVAYDITKGDERSVIFRYLSIPGDILFDTVFLPFDVIGWCFGYHKKSKSNSGGGRAIMDTRAPG